MTVSKRLKFEIRRRDNFTCRYCGAKAPDVELTVDHVVPKALGGSDDASNLVTACVDCNAGKSSAPIDGVIVDDVNRRSREWSAAMAEAMASWHEERQDDIDALKAFEDAWYRWSNGSGETPSMELKWRDTVRYWLEKGFEVDALASLMEHSMTKDKIAFDQKWRYYCGVVWRTLDDIEERVHPAPKRQPEAEAYPEPQTQPLEPDMDDPRVFFHAEWLEEMFSDDRASRTYPEQPVDLGYLFAQLDRGIT